MSEESSDPLASETTPESAPPVDSSDTTPPVEAAVVEIVEPVRPFTLQTPANLRILFHLPPQGRGYTGKINGLFFYTDSLGRIDKNGAHSWEGGMHVFDGRLLTVEEFMTPRVQKYLADDSLVIRPLVRAVMLPDGVEPVEAAPPVISKDDLRILVGQLDQMRQTLEARQTRIDELESENSTYRQAIERIEAENKKTADVTPPEDKTEDKPAKASKASKASKTKKPIVAE